MIQARDCLISAGQGRPRVINIKDCEVKPPHLGDFPSWCSKGSLFIAYVEVCSILGELTECCSRKHLPRHRRLHLENALYRWSRDLPKDLRLFQQSRATDGSTESLDLRLPYNFEARQLHVPYFVTLIIIHRPSSPDGVPSAAALLASSFVAGIFEEFLARDELRFLGPIFTSYLLAAGVAQLSCHHYPYLWQAAEQELSVINTSQRELGKRWPSAIGALNALQNIRDAVSKQAGSGLPTSIIGLSGEQHAFFECFGPHLCRQWAPIMSPRAPVRQSDQGQYNSTESDMMTAGILAELKTPAATPALERMPLAMSSHYGDADTGADESLLRSSYEGIGNWLLSEWGSQATW